MSRAQISVCEATTNGVVDPSTPTFVALRTMMAVACHMSIHVGLLEDVSWRVEYSDRGGESQLICECSCVFECCLQMWQVFVFP